MMSPLPPSWGPAPELAPDLEWMLQSGQVGPELLAGALVKEFYTPLYRLALGLLDDASAAAGACQAGLVAALLDVHRLQNGSQEAAKPRLWFWRQAWPALAAQARRMRTRRALQTVLPRPVNPHRQGMSAPRTEAEADLWLALDALPLDQRRVCFLGLLLDWPLSEIEACLAGGRRRRAGAAAAQWERAWRQVRTALRRSGCPEAGLEDADLIAWAKESLTGRWPAPELSVEEPARIAAQAAASAGQRAFRRRGLVSAKELLLTGVGIGLVLAAVWSVNILFPEPPLSSGAPSTRLVTRVVAVSPQALVATPGAQPTPTLAIVRADGALYYTVQPGDTLTSIARRLGVTVQMLVERNRMTADEILVPGRALFIDIDATPAPEGEPTPVPPVDLPAPLDASATSDQILARVLGFSELWNTVWVDGWMVFYGPPGYIGPPRGEHIQAWISRPRRSLEIIGLMDGPGARRAAYLTDGFNRYSFSTDNNVAYTQKTTGLLVDSYLNDLLFPVPSDLIPGLGKIQVVEMGEFMGRPALVVDRLDLNGRRTDRLWLEPQRGVILRWQHFDGLQGEVVVTDFMLAATTFDQAFPAGTFDLNRVRNAGFASGADLKPLSAEAAQALTAQVPLETRPTLPYIPAPAGFNPAASRLAFQFLPDVDTSGLLRDPQAQYAYLFGDDFYLGRVRFANPWAITCARSPDGLRIAFAGVTAPGANPTSPRTNLGWFRLDGLDNVQFLPDGNGVNQIAFAPDSRRLAFFHVRTSAVEILDTDTGKTQSVIKIGDAKSFVWNPDGKSLAFIARERDSFEDQVMVVRVEDGEVIYRSSVDSNQGNFTDWPMLQWQVDFPVEMGGLQACIAPPAH